MTTLGSPRVRGNDWRTISVPDLGTWAPSLSVSVVVPAYRAERTLPFTLAALSAQTYPADLLEVIVVDDEGGLELPELRPARTRLLRTSESWGRAHACAVGAQAATGDVIHWLDADMLAYADHVEAQMRWHHAIDHAVVLGHKMFVDPPLESLSVADVRRAVAEGHAQDLFVGLDSWTHDWVEAFYERTDGLSTAGWTAYAVHVGATASVRRDVYTESGGMDSSLKLGEDIDLGYRLAQVGSVFVPERAARSWHLGPTHVMKRREEVNRYNAPYLTDRIAQLRWRRTRPGRTYSVPYVEVLVDTASQRYETVVAMVDGVLASTISDVQCTLLGPWSALRDERRPPLDDALGEYRMLHAAFVGDARVHLAEDVADDPFPTPFRLVLPAGWTVEPKALEALLRHMEHNNLGLRQVLLGDGTVATVTRTAALRRARRVAGPKEDIIDVVDDVYGTWWGSGEEDGFRHHPALTPLR